MGALEMIAHAAHACDRARMPCKGCKEKTVKGATDDGAHGEDDPREEIAEVRALTYAGLKAAHENAHRLSVRLLIAEVVLGGLVGLVLFRVVRGIA